jgi:hypothetical protein
VPVVSMTAACAPGDARRCVVIKCNENYGHRVRRCMRGVTSGYSTRRSELNASRYIKILYVQSLPTAVFPVAFSPLIHVVRP